MIGRGSSAPRREGASQSRTGWRERYNGWLQHHRLSAADSMSRVIDNPGTSLLTWLVIGIALALPTGLDVALDNVSQLSVSWDSPAQISLFLQDEVSDERARELQQELIERPDIAQTRFVSRQEALEEFRTLSGFADVLDSLDSNPLPHLILVSPADSSAQAAAIALRDELQSHPGVAQAVLDMEWLQRLNSLMELGRRLVLAVAVLLVVGVLLILGNTIRLAIEGRREEIVIIKLVGEATPLCGGRFSIQVSGTGLAAASSPACWWPGRCGSCASPSATSRASTRANSSCVGSASWAP